MFLYNMDFFLLHLDFMRYTPHGSNRANEPVYKLKGSVYDSTGLYIRPSGLFIRMAKADGGLTGQMSDQHG
jgi:hypothetical protein